jgi:putative transcriptional regulator
VARTAMGYFQPAAGFRSGRAACGALATFVLAAALVCVYPLALRAASPAHAQGSGAQPKNKQAKKAHQPTYLVAREEISDPFFSESAVLIVPTDQDSLVLGLIVNKPTHIPLSELFPDDDALKGKTQTIYFGGPVDTDDAGVVFRSPKAMKPAVLLFGDVYVSFDRDFIEGLLEKPGQAHDVRLFVGRAQWDPDQLQDEILEGSWYSIQAESSFIFSAEPKYVWHTLFEIAEPSPVVRFQATPAGVSVVEASTGLQASN